MTTPTETAEKIIQTAERILGTNRDLGTIVLRVFIFTYLMGTGWFILHWEDLQVPRIVYGDGTVVQGNCSFLLERVTDIEAGVIGWKRKANNLPEDPGPSNLSYKFIEINLTLTPTTSTLSCPPAPTCPPTPTCPSCPTCPDCPPCPPVSEEIKHQVLTMRWDNPASSCAQGGYNAGRADCQFIVGVGKTYNGRPVYGYQVESLQPKNYTQNLICFTRDGDGFNINRTPDQNGRPRWGWDDSQCLTSWLHVRDL